PSPTRPGSTIPPAYGGRPSSPSAMRPPMARTSPKRFAPTPNKPVALRARPRHGRRNHRALQRPLPLHGQFGALDPGRGDPEPDRRRRLPRLFGRVASERRGQSGGVAASARHG